MRASFLHRIAQLLRHKVTLVVMVAIASGTGYYYWQELPWQKLPGGGEMMVLKVDPGPMAEVSFTPNRYRLLNWASPRIERVSDMLHFSWLPSAWNRLRGPGPFQQSIRIQDGEMVTWILMRDDARFQYKKCRLLYPDGQEFKGWCMETQGDGMLSLYYIQHMFVPRSSPTLRLRLEASGRPPYLLEVPNALFTPDLPRWTAQPLPQTQHLEAMDVTLSAVTSRFEPEPSPNDTTWLADAAIQVEMKAGARLEWFDFWTTFCDPDGHESSGTGVFSQPVWKVKFRITPNEHHPASETTPETVAEFLVKPPAPPSR